MIIGGKNKLHVGKIKENKGISLIELMIVLGLMSILFLIGGTGIYQLNQAKLEKTRDIFTSNIMTLRNHSLSRVEKYYLLIEAIEDKYRLSLYEEKDNRLIQQTTFMKGLRIYYNPSHQAFDHVLSDTHKISYSQGKGSIENGAGYYKLEKNADEYTVIELIALTGKYYIRE